MSEETTKILNSLRNSTPFREWLQAIDPRGARGTAAIGLAIAIAQLADVHYTRWGGDALPTRVCEHVIIADPGAGKTWVLERIAAAVAKLRAEGHAIEVIESRAQSGQALDDQLARVWCERVAATASGASGEEKKAEAAAATVWQPRDRLPAVLILLDEEGAATASQAHNGAIDPYTDRRQVTLNQLCSGTWQPSASRTHKEKYPTIHGVRCVIVKTAQPKNAPYLLTPGSAQGAERRRLYWTLETSASMPTRTGDQDADDLAEALWRQQRAQCVSSAYLAAQVNEQVKRIFTRAQREVHVDMPLIYTAEQGDLYPTGTELDGLECVRAAKLAAGSCQLYRSERVGGEDVAYKQAEHIVLIMAALRLFAEPEAPKFAMVTAADYALACDVIALSREVYERYAAPDLTSSSAEVAFKERLDAIFAVAGRDRKCNQALQSTLRTTIGRDKQRQQWFLDYAEANLRRVKIKDKYLQFVLLDTSEREAREQLIPKVNPQLWRAATIAAQQRAQPAPVAEARADRCSAALAAVSDEKDGTIEKTDAIFNYLGELSQPSQA